MELQLWPTFINIAAHELRTPIEPLLLGSEQLKEMMPNEEIVSIVLGNAKKLQALSNTILDASKSLRFTKSVLI